MKLKKNVDPKTLEKFGFQEVTVKSRCKDFDDKPVHIIIADKIKDKSGLLENRKIDCDDRFGIITGDYYGTLDNLFDLIKAGLVEKDYPTERSVLEDISKFEESNKDFRGMLSDELGDYLTWKESCSQENSFGDDTLRLSWKMSYWYLAGMFLAYGWSRDVLESYITYFAKKRGIEREIKEKH